MCDMKVLLAIKSTQVTHVRGTFTNEIRAKIKDNYSLYTTL